MWWIIELLWVISVIIVVAMCMCGVCCRYGGVYRLVLEYLTMWWIIGLLWVIAVIIVVAMCMSAKEPDCELYSSGYQNAMNLYFIHGANINTLKEFIKDDIRHDQYCDDSRGLDDAIDVLESFRFPDTYDGEYLP